MQSQKNQNQNNTTTNNTLNILPPPLLLPTPILKQDQYLNKLIASNKSNFKNQQQEMLNKHPPIETIHPQTLTNRLYSPQQLQGQDKKLFTNCPTCDLSVKIQILEDHQKCHATHIGNGLYLGSCVNSSNLRQLKRLKIQGILNCATQIPNTYRHEQEFTYKKLGLTDCAGQSIKSQFDQCIQFIDQHIKNKKGILVHCAMGKSRSVAITLAYLMRKQKINLKQAYYLVKQKRNIIKPNKSYVEQLLQLDYQLFKSKSIDLQEIQYA